jgi:hypothetical protein
VFPPVGKAPVMGRSLWPGLALLLAIAVAAALTYPRSSDRVARMLYESPCTSGLPCNRVTGVAMPEEPSLADLLLHHPPSRPTR